LSITAKTVAGARKRRVDPPEPDEAVAGSAVAGVAWRTVAKIHAGATLTPPFRDFLPPWVAAQPWYRGSAVPVLSPVGSFRFEDPAGEVGVETHLVTDGVDLYQVPMTYRGSPAPGVPANSLITTAEHGVLGTRWIYDGQADPLWHDRVLHLVGTGGVSDTAGRRNAGSAEARGESRVPGPLTPDVARVELLRVPAPGPPPSAPHVAGVVVGTWYPPPAGTAATSGCLAVVTLTGRPHDGVVPRT
jgi:hypothetical protein